MAYAMFTDPPQHLASEHQDEKRQSPKEGSEEGNLIKLLIDEESGRFLGASILGINADEILQSISLVMAANGTIPR